MKRVFSKSLLAMACLLGSTSVSAYDFEVDGIYYDVVSLSELTCKVAKGSYSGDIVIPATVNYANRTLTVVGIATDVFRGCSVTAITIPNIISSIDNYVFNGCTKLVRVTIEDGNTVLELGHNYEGKDEGNGYTAGKGLFYDCPIESLYLGRNLLYESGYFYGNSPFAFNELIKEVTIGNFVTSIGSHAFYGCSGLTNVTIGNSVTSIGPDVFCGCSGLTSVTIPNSVTSIGHSAFYDCSGLTSVTIGNSVTSIGTYVFYGCSGLTSVTIPNSVTSIGFGAFRGCSGLTSVTIPNSVTSIDDYAFSGCSALSTLYSLNTTPPSVGSEISPTISI